MNYDDDLAHFVNYPSQLQALMPWQMLHLFCVNGSATMTQQVMLLLPCILPPGSISYQPLLTEPAVERGLSFGSETDV